MSRNEDVLRGVTDDSTMRPSILSPETGEFRVFDLEDACSDETPIGEIVDGTLFRGQISDRLKSRYASGCVALAHLMPQVYVDYCSSFTLDHKLVIKEDFTLGDIAQRIIQYNIKMPSELRLRVPFALSHIGYEADGSKRTQTETCAAVFLSVSLGEGVLTGAEIRHALRPVDVSSEGASMLSHDLLNHFLGRGTSGRVQSEIYLGMGETMKARKLSKIPFCQDGSIQCGVKPGLLDYSSEWVDSARGNLTVINTAYEHRKKSRSTSAPLRWLYAS